MDSPSLLTLRTPCPVSKLYTPWQIIASFCHISFAAFTIIEITFLLKFKCHLLNWRGCDPKLPGFFPPSPTEGTQLPKAPDHPASGTECSFWSLTASHCVALLCGTRGRLCTVLMWLQLLDHRCKCRGVLLLLVCPPLTWPFTEQRIWTRLWNKCASEQGSQSVCYFL